MGQCKSKVKVLESHQTDTTEKEDKVSKSNKRKWRKSKGYSLSESVEESLHRFPTEKEVSQQIQSCQSAVLVSFNAKSEVEGHPSQEFRLSQEGRPVRDHYTRTKSCSSTPLDTIQNLKIVSPLSDSYSNITGNKIKCI